MNMEGDRISIIVPVYNTAPWLRRCLDSICAQTYWNLEILCVNDGSTDNSAEILEEYAAWDSRIKVFTQENAGLSAARNTALDYASGEWISAVDSDDFLPLDAMANALACASEEVDMVFSHIREVREDGSMLPVNDYFDLPADGEYTLTPKLAGELYVCFWGKLMRRSVIEKIGLRFPVGLLHEDDAFYYRFIPHVRRIATCHKDGYFYVQRSGSIMHSGQSELVTAKRYMNVTWFVCEECRKRGENPAESPWCQLMVSRIYRDRCIYVPEHQRGELQDMCYALAVEFGFLPGLYGDFRFRRIVPVRGWKRLFLGRYVQSEVWRFFGVPVWMSVFKDEELLSSRLVFFTAIRSKLFRK